LQLPLNDQFFYTLTRRAIPEKVFLFSGEPLPWQARISGPVKQTATICRVKSGIWMRECSTAQAETIPPALAGTPVP
jgi:hypothetical protein